MRDEEGNVSTVHYEAVYAMLLNEFLKEHDEIAEQESRLVKQEAIITRQQKQIEILATGLQQLKDRREVAEPTLQLAGGNHH